MLPKSDIRIESIFPDLKKLGYLITSPITQDYNCIAWAAGEQNRRWDPDPGYQYYWPPHLPRRIDIKVFEQAYESCGYEVCENGDFEDGCEKIVIYVDNAGSPTHAARQLIESKTWTSKLGDLYDISHHIYGLNGQSYGIPKVYMVRKINTSI